MVYHLFGGGDSWLWGHPSQSFWPVSAHSPTHSVTSTNHPFQCSLQQGKLNPYGSQRDCIGPLTLGFCGSGSSGAPQLPILYHSCH